MSAQPRQPQFDAARLRALLKRVKVSNRGLAEHLGVEGTTVDRWARGSHTPGALALAALAEWSHVSMDEWMMLPAANMLHPAPDCDTVGEQ